MGYLVETKPQITQAREKPFQKKTTEVLPQPGPSKSQKTVKIPKQATVTPKATTTRKCLIDKVSSTGIFSCTEVVDSTTFVAYLLSEDFYEELSLLEEIGDDCSSDTQYKLVAKFCLF